ncbi:MAG: ribosome small subunit-dependent GTPase A [Clostridia bacterium]|nr:ribosome small subunit-dependent GTPase A [Clostridia bacterium]
MLLKGTIVKGIGGFYYVDTEMGIIECRARGKFRKTDIIPIVGDRVTIEVEKGSGSVKEIEERRNFLVRPPVSNIDVLVVVAAEENPAPDFLLIDKMLVIAAEKSIDGIVCVNKSDLDGESAEKIRTIYKNAGYEAFTVSAVKNAGIDELKSALTGKTAAFAGLSGVGKSSLLSRITGRELAVGETSRIERGKHTTRHIELIKTDEGYVFDTPGFSQLEIEAMKCGELKEYFPEIWQREGECRFRGCSHTAEPDCAVKTAVSAGEIAQSRYESYVKLYEKLKEIKDWEL